MEISELLAWVAILSSLAALGALVAAATYMAMYVLFLGRWR
jgi:hypothetical protein